MARHNERYSWDDDWADDGEDRRLSDKRMVTEASLEEHKKNTTDSALITRDRCDDLLAIKREPKPKKKGISILPANANPKKYLN